MKMINQKEMKTIGILGGMGPESSVSFFMEVIKECQKQYNAKYDEDYPKIIMYNVPIPDIVENINNLKETIKIVGENLQQLEKDKVDFIVIPCNTINIIYNEMCRAVKIPVLSIIKETINKAKELKLSKVGIIGTKATINFGLYQKELDKNKISYILPEKEEMNILTKIIINIMAGKKTKEDLKKIKKIIQTMKNKGAEAVIIGCTDLPLLVKQENFDILLLDTIKILAEATVRNVITAQTI